MGGFLPPGERHSSVLLALYTALSLLLLIFSDRIPTGFLRGAGAWAFAPLDRIVLAVDRIAAAWRENQRLHERITRLEIENIRLRNAGRENDRLRQSLGLPPWAGVSLKPAEILSLSGEPLPAAATLSVGKRQGVQEGDVVVTGDGLLGWIGESYPNFSRVVLLTDPNSAVACEVETTGVLGMLHFMTAPHPRLILTGIPLSDTVRVGELVVTSGMSQRYPRGIPVGVVERVTKNLSGLTHDIDVRPAARMSRLRHGFVIARPSSLASGP